MATVVNGLPFGPITLTAEAAGNYPAVITADGPQGYWRLNETSGTTANDSSGKGNTLTYGGTYTLGVPGGIAGDPDTAVQFTGTGGVASRTTAPVSTASNWSEEAWIYPTALNQLGVVVFDGIDASGQGGYGFGMGSSTGTAGSNLIAFLGSAGVADSGYTFPSANNWYHLVVTRDTSTVRFYVNGSPTSLTSTKVPTAPGARFSVGAGVNGSGGTVNPFLGRVDEAAIYGTQFQVGRVIAHYQEGFGAASAFGNWLKQTPTTSPAARFDPSMVFDGQHNKVVMFGGNKAGAATNETWTYDGANWTQLNPTGSPSARYGASMAYDAATQTIVLFGGYTGSTYLSDTWSWNGTTWSQLSPSASPAVRDFASAAYDKATSTIVVFGGYNGRKYLNDTWSWNGTTWSQKSPSSSPSIRNLAASAYLDGNNTIVLFGGYNGTSRLADTWIWNGTTWSSPTLSAAPSGRQAAGAVYDATTGRLMLFGGYTGSAYLNDTWAWDGTTWSTQAPSANPPVRADMGFAYQSNTGAAVLFGGTSGSGLNDTYQWETPSGPPATVTATAGNAQATVNWSIPSSNGGQAISKYTLTPYTGTTALASQTITPPTTTATFAGLTNGTSYSFQVTATNSIGIGAALVSNTVTPATVPSAPTNVSATDASTQATVSWNAPSSNGGALISAYTVTPYNGNNAGTPVQVSGSTLSTTISGLTNGMSYTFQATASNSAGTGPAATSNLVVVGAPGPPQNVSATAGTGQASISWQAPAWSGGPAVSGYTVTPYVGGSAGTPVNVGGSTLTTTVTGLTNGTTYTFQVTATNGVATGPAATSNGVTPTGPPTAPTNVTATSANASANVSWGQPASNGGLAITGYTVTPVTGGNAGTPVSVGATTYSTTVSNLTNGATYTFQVTATNSSGTGPYAVSNAIVVGAPSPPTNVSASAGANQATITWTAPSGGTVTNYIVTSLIGSTPQNSQGVVGTATIATMTGLKGGTAYTFQVNAVNSYGASPPSSPSSAVTPSGNSSTYASTVIADGPTAYYRLGEPSGTAAADSSGNGRLGTYTGSTTLGVGGALVSDTDTAAHSVVLAPSSGLPVGNASRTAEAWIDTAVANAGQGIVGYGSNPSYSYHQAFEVELAGNNQIHLVLGQDDRYFSSPYPLNDGTWHQVVVTYDGLLATAYVDGQSLGGQSLSSLNTVLDANGLVTGQGFWCCGPDVFSGSLDEVAVYPGALSFGQITNHFNASGNTRPTAPTNVSATVGGNQATVTWAAATASAGAPVNGYIVTAYNGSQAANSLGVSGTTTSATITGLQANVPFTFKVAAANRFGYGALSAPSSAVTPTGISATYASTVIADGPAVYYRVGEGSGFRAADSSGHGQNATFNGNYTLGAAGALANDSDSGVSTGNNASVQLQLTNGLPVGNTARSVEIWFRGTGTGALVGYGSNPAYSTRQTFELNVVSSNQVQIQVGGDDKTFAVPYYINNGAWHQLVMTYDGTTVTAYVDGINRGSATFAAALNTIIDTNGLVAGQNFWCCDSAPYIGSLDEASVYSVALSATQVANHFTASANARPTAPTGVTATAGANQATVTWSAATGSPGTPVTGYVVTAYAGTLAQNSTAVNGTSTSTPITGLKAGTAYTFRVTANDNFGLGYPSTASNAITPTGVSSTYASTVLGDTPVLYYRLGDPSGSLAADSSGNGAVGSYNGSYTLGSSGALVSDSDGAYAPTNGSDMQFKLGTGLLGGNTARSMDIWFKTNSNGTLLGYGSNPAYSTRQTFLASVTGNYQLQVVVGGEDKLFNSTYPIENGGWHYATVTYDGTTLTVYLDGQSLGTATFTAALNTVQDGNGLMVGQAFWCCGSGQFIGTLDEAAVYPTALSAAAVMNHFNASGNSRPGPPTNIKATAGPGAVLLRWTAPASLGSPPLTGYQVVPYIGSTAGTPFTVAPGLTSALMSWLTANTTYTFQVQSVNNFGLTTATSNAITTTTALTSGYVFNSLEVSVGYADCRSSGTMPHPWAADINVAFIGSCLDSGAIRIYNLSTAPITLADVSMDQAGTHFDLWGSNLTVQPATSLILSQTANFNFDTSDAGQNCNPSLTLPVVHITVGTTTQDYQDSGQVLNTGGIDMDTCTGRNESAQWQDIGGGPQTSEIYGPNGSEHICWACLLDPINTATGGFSETYTDFSIPGRGIPLIFQRTYNSLQAGYDGPLGYGWNGGYEMFLVADGVTGNVLVHQEGGSIVSFALVNGVYKAPPRVLATLTLRGDGSYLFKRADQTSFVFNARGEPTQGVDRNGYVTSFSYTNDLLSVVTDPAGRTLTFSYTGDRITGIADSSGRNVIFQYDANGNLASAQDVGGGLTSFGYDGNHLLQTITDPNLGVTTNVYDSAGRVTSQTDAMNRRTSVGYVGGQVTVTDPIGNVEVQQYANNELLSDTRGSGTPQAATWTYGYDPATLGTTSVTDPNVHQMVSTYDTNGNLLTQTDALQRRTVYTYNGLNEVLTAKDRLNITTTSTYDANGNLQQASRPLTGTAQVATTTYTYDPMNPGDVIQVTDPDNKVWTYAYDLYGNKVRAVDPVGDITTYGYDTIGRMTSRVTPNGNVTGGNPSAFTTSYTYNAFGDLLTATDPLGHETIYKYDGNRNMTQVTDPNNNATIYSYDLDNEQTHVTRADSSVLTTDFNPDGTALDQKDGKNSAIQTFSYDSQRRLTSATDALGNATSYTYDGAGNQLTKQDPGGNCNATPKTGCTTYIYDAANELTSITYSDGLTPNVSNITYDNDGQRTSMTDGTGTSSWVWDSLHRLVSYTNGTGAQVQYGYNLRDLLTTITYPAGLNVTRGYDDAGRFTSVQDWLSNTTSFGYDPNSNLTTETLPTGSSIIDTFSFDAADRLLGVSDVKTGNTTLFSATYTRDNANQLTSDTSAPAATGSYKYTSMNQVCYSGASTSNGCGSPPSGATPYVYDAADNLTQMGTTQQAFNAADELCWSAPTAGSCASPPSGATSYSYDLRGNRTQITPPSGGATTLSYDQANRLTAYGSTGTYAYNGDGLRMSKTVSGATTQFLWDTSAGLPLPIKDGATAYVYGPGGLPLEQINGSSALWLHHDQLGSTRLVSDSSGTSQATYAFDAYGNQTSGTGSIPNPFLFAGQYRDGESGWYYLRSRYYDDATGQFISRDPLTGTTRQPYSYVSGNPLSATDPSGLCWPDWACHAAAAVVGGVGAFVGNASDNLTSGNPLKFALGVGESVVIAAPVAAVVFVAGGGAAVAAGLEAIGTAFAEGAAAFDAAAVITPSEAAAEAGASSTNAFGQALWGSGEAGARALMGARTAAELRSLGMSTRLACGLRNFYQAAAAAGQGGAAATARAELMQHIMDLLSNG
ncbi:MAG: hypothetical protein QOH92_2269 [Chloroflexota bacterium]|nr:hypothetical protein [Chloroflexota bacterium]